MTTSPRPAAADAPEVRADLAPLLQPVLDRCKVPALAAAVVRADGPVRVGAVGVRQAGRKEKVTADDRFHIGSCTKAMTATLCARLVEQGKLSWATTLGAGFPDLAAAMHKDYRGVTLEQLLTNRGGFPTDVPDPLWKEVWQLHGKPTAARAHLLKALTAEPPAAPPGGMFLYSNAGFAAAGHLAERVTKKPWEALMKEQLFTPLGMKSAGFGAPGSAGAVDQPRGHSAEGKAVVPSAKGSDNPSGIGPAGTVHCTMADWAKFARLHLRGARGKADLLRAETFARLHAPAKGDGEPYACGWGVAERDWSGGPALTHAGSNTMWYAVIWVAPQRDLAVLAACNQGGPSGRQAVDDAAATLIQAVLKPSKD
jgi:CubicO group peptidase (beta-lactamase class C family)